ncbi:MAG: hypothetical protein RLP16_06510 [Alphaproteobacteria bacterium]
MFSKFKRLYFISAVTAVFLTAAGGTAQAEDFILVVNSANPIAAGGDTKTVIKRLYLKQMSEWPHGEKSIVFDREPDSAAYQGFIASVLGMSQAELDDHWLRLKQTTGDTPPRSVGSARILVRQIEKNAGALSYMPASEAEDLGEGVKILLKF